MAAAANQTESPIASSLKSSEAEIRLRQVRGAGISPSVQKREERIRVDLEAMKLDANARETVDLLIHHLAISQTLFAAEWVYRTIFGSQIALLRSLNVSGTAPRMALEAVYDLAKSKFPELYNTYSFAQWLDYLLSMGLIAKNDNEHYSIAVDGKEFLKWMTDAAVSENKSF